MSNRYLEGGSGIGNGNGHGIDEGDRVELRLPPRSEYLPLLRAAVGVVAGGMSFSYDEVLQLRVAAAEAFGLATRRLAVSGLTKDIKDVAVRLLIRGAGLEIVVEDPAAHEASLERREQTESEAVLESLVDRVEFADVSAGEPVIRLVKLKAHERA